MRIGIIASMHLAEQMLDVREKLRSMGHDAYCTGFTESFIGKTDDEKQSLKVHQQYHQDAIRDFWNDMQNGDAVLVLNLDRKGIKNYIGGNTLMEIGFAHVLNQKIFLYNPVPDIEFYKSEIEAVKPVIINGDLTKIE